MRTSLSFFAALPLLAASTATNFSPTQAAPAKSALRSWVSLRATTDKARYTVGETINVRLTARNTAKRGAYLRFTSGQRFDLQAFRQGEKEPSYTWSASRMFTMATGSLWLKSGQSQVFDASIGDEMGPLRPGKYLLRAQLSNSPRPIEAPPVSFEITEPAISLTTRTNKTSYAIGERVQVEVAVANRSAQAQRLNFESGLDCDVVVSTEAGAPVWTYGANLRFIRALGEVTWNKGETKNYSRTWNGNALPSDATPAQLEPGRYQVQAVLRSKPEVLGAPVFIELTR
jgi:hypothetical protein